MREIDSIREGHGMHQNKVFLSDYFWTNHMWKRFLKNVDIVYILCIHYVYTMYTMPKYFSNFLAEFDNLKKGLIWQNNLICITE